MNKRNWLIPILIVVINALAIIVRWGSLSELIPAHFDLQGNASGTMPRSVLSLQSSFASSDLAKNFSLSPQVNDFQIV